MKTYPTTTVQLISRSKFTNREKRKVASTGDPKYTNPTSISTNHDFVQSPPSPSPPPLSQPQESQSIVPFEHSNAASNANLKNPLAGSNKSKSSRSTVLKIVLVITLFILIAGAIVIGILALLQNKINTTTTTTTTTTTSTAIPLPSQCYSYSTLSDSTRLATASGGSLSDRGFFGPAYVWYRFSGASGSQIATLATAYYQCSTTYPGWYSSAMPLAGYNVSGTVCFANPSNICYYTIIILVTNCNTYYVYGLIDPPVSPARYCTA